MASWLSIMPSPLPPFAGLSNSASAAKPFRLFDRGCGVKLPNSSRPLSTVPFPFLCSTRKASSEPAAVQSSRSVVPLVLMSKLTPRTASVRLNPLPSTSMRMGLSQQLLQLGSQLLVSSPHKFTQPPPPPPPHERSVAVKCPSWPGSTPLGPLWPGSLGKPPDAASPELPH